MVSPVPPASRIADPMTHAAPAIGAHSRPVRFLIVGLVVGVWCLLGFVLQRVLPQPVLPLYLLLGVPLLLLFQLGIHRQPLRTLWVRVGPPFVLDGPFLVLWGLFALFPLYAVVREVLALRLANAAEYSVALVGAFGLAYALRAMRASTWRQLGLCVVTVGVIGLLPQFVALLLPHIVHLHTAHPVTTTPLTMPQRLEIAAQWLLIAPVGFVVEEVFFRGGLDTYLHRGEAGTGWLSAIYVAALWGVWHLPGQALSGNLLAAVLGTVLPQILVGAPLSLWWRQSGNLAVTDTAHGLLEAVRNALVGASLF